MSTQKNLQIARLWFEEIWSKPNPDLADKLVAPSYAPEWIQIEVKGPAQVKHEIRYLHSAFPDLNYQIVDSIASEDRVWVRYKATGTQCGNAWGFEPTDKKVNFEGVTILYINPEGKIIDRWGSFCFYDIFEELGLVPPFWELSQHFPPPTES